MSDTFFRPPRTRTRPPQRIGATCYETRVAMDHIHQTISARFTELRQWGYIDYLRDVNSRVMTRPTDTDSPAIVHVLTARGKQAVELGLPIQKQNGAHDPTQPYHGGVATSRQAYARSKETHASLRLRVLQYLYPRTD